MAEKKQASSLFMSRMAVFIILSALIILFLGILIYSFYYIVHLNRTLTDLFNFERDYLEASYKIQEIVTENTLEKSYTGAMALFHNCDAILDRLEADPWFNRFTRRTTDLPESIAGIVTTWNILQNEHLPNLRKKMDDIHGDQELLDESRMTNLENWLQSLISRGDFSANAFELVSRVERIQEFRPRFFSQFTVARDVLVADISRVMRQIAFIAPFLSILIFVLGISVIVRELRQRLQFQKDLEYLVEVRTRELESTQIRLIESEKLASLVKLTKGLAHEFNTPLGNIRMAVSLLNEMTEKMETRMGGGEDSAGDISDIFASVVELVDIVSRNTEKNIEVLGALKNIQIDDLGELPGDIRVRDFFGNIKKYIAIEGTSGTWELSTEIPEDFTFMTYTLSLLMIFKKLIQNTIIHSGYPEEECSVSITVRRTGEDIRIVYSDRGKGISGAAAENIFMPFARLQGSREHHGLGLFTVYSLVVNRLGGTIEYDSGYKDGVRFTLHLPIKPPKTTTS